MLNSVIRIAEEKETERKRIKAKRRRKEAEKEVERKLIEVRQRRAAAEKEAQQSRLEAERENQRKAMSKELGRRITASEDARFFRSADGVVFDADTELEWVCARTWRVKTWYQVKAWIDGLAICGGGWRFPTIGELKKLRTEKSRRFPRIFDTQRDIIWTDQVHEYTLRKFNKTAYMCYKFLENKTDNAYPSAHAVLMGGLAVRTRR